MKHKFLDEYRRRFDSKYYQRMVAILNKTDCSCRCRIDDDIAQLANLRRFRYLKKLGEDIISDIHAGTAVLADYRLLDDIEQKCALAQRSVTRCMMKQHELTNDLV